MQTGRAETAERDERSRMSRDETEDILYKQEQIYSRVWN
jgi:hypothetical protein